MSSSATDFDVEDFPEMDVGDVDSEKIGSHIKVDKPGLYHFAITDSRPRLDPSWSTGTPRKKDILVTCEVLESVQGQSGKGAVFFHEVPISGKGGGPMEEWDLVKAMNFLSGLGILVKQGDKFIDPETGTTAVNTRTLAGRIAAVQQFIADVKLSKSDDPKYDGNPELSFGRGAYLVDDPVVQSVPKNLKALTAIGKAHAAASATVNGGNSKASGKGTGKKPDPAPQQQPAESAIDTSDL